MKTLTKICLLFVLIVCAARAFEPVDVLVQGAEKLEVEAIVAALEKPERIEIGAFPFWLGKIGRHRVAVSLTGQALINCTAATLTGIEEFHPKLIVNQGTSGAQVANLTLHDIVVGSTAIDYGNFTSQARAKGKGSAPLTWTPVYQGLRNARGEWKTYPFGFKGDPECLAIALRTVNKEGKVVAGTIGSAHEVNLELDRVRWTHETFDLDVEEMESGHIAALAEAFQIRYIAFRVVSDAPYAGIDFEPEAAVVTAKFTVSFLHQLPAL